MESAVLAIQLPLAATEDSARGGMFGAVGRWDQWLAAQGRAPQTRRSYRYAVVRFLSEVCPDSLDAVTEQDVVVFLASLDRHASARSMYVRALHSFFGWACSHGVTPTDPSRLLQPRDPWRPPPEALSQEELARLLYCAALRSERKAWGIMLAYGLGCRRQEVCGITADDVDWEHERVLLRVTKGSKPRAVEMSRPAREALLGLLGQPPFRPHGQTPEAHDTGLDPPPARAAAHVDHLNLAAVLLEDRRITEEDKVVGGASHGLSTVPPRDSSVYSKDGRGPARVVLGIAPGTFTYWVKQCAQDARLPVRKQRAHILRATYATNLLGAGVPVSVVSGLLGHSDVSTTTRYLAITSTDRRRAVELI